LSEQTGSESSNGASGVGRPSTRAARLQMVRQLLADNVVTSQAQLSELLAREGFPVTQATMSRDLDEVNAAKTRLADGTIAYAVADQVPLATVPESNGQGRGEQQLAKILTGLVVSVAHASNFVIVHTPAGAAQYVASGIDKHSIDGVLGTIAGDDTILIICSDDTTAGRRAEWMLRISSRS
jgi:transcriptional regulator of arginine metabolism